MNKLRVHDNIFPSHDHWKPNCRWMLRELEISDSDVNAMGHMHLRYCQHFQLLWRSNIIESTKGGTSATPRQFMLVYSSSVLLSFENCFSILIRATIQSIADELIFFCVKLRSRSSCFCLSACVLLLIFVMYFDSFSLQPGLPSLNTLQREVLPISST